MLFGQKGINLDIKVNSVVHVYCILYDIRIHMYVGFVHIVYSLTSSVKWKHIHNRVTIIYKLYYGKIVNFMYMLHKYMYYLIHYTYSERVLPRIRHHLAFNGHLLT